MWKIKYPLILLFLFSLLSCSEKTENSTFWGETEYYSDFLFYKYTPVIMEKKLKFDFNEDAQAIRGVKLGLFEKDDKERLRPATEDIKLYKDGTLCPGNVFTVSGGDQEAMIGLEFTGDARAGIHKWYLMVIDNGGLDRVNEYDTESDATPLLMEWRAKKTHVWNPLKLILFWTVAALLALLLLWMLVLRGQLYPRFRVGAFIVTDPYYSMRRLRGCYKLVCTNKAVRQSAWSKFFKGKVAYEVNPFWTREWVITPRDGASVKPNTSSEYSFEPYTVTLRKGNEYKVTNHTTGEKITVTIN